MHVTSSSEMQVLLTTAVSAATVLYRPVNAALDSSPGLALALALLPLFLLFPLYYYQQKHPLNFAFLGLFTVCLSLSVGVACANTQGRILPWTNSICRSHCASLDNFHPGRIRMNPESFNCDVCGFSTHSSALILLRKVQPLPQTEELLHLLPKRGRRSNISALKQVLKPSSWKGLKVEQSTSHLGDSGMKTRPRSRTSEYKVNVPRHSIITY
ncbi:hypothetical protein OPV22_013241 [Ensete ventricosum]|uniref:Uncharacterized protein n=1 Tax=Ensete ventricosum TaxID=4639 RepID=A0AAV8QYX9_ENSVE|nr:hypothetical protein OPV22_013241 [Ensete ventricosum]